MTKTLKEKRLIYNNVFENEGGRQVLSDLRRFCFATKTPYSSDPIEMARNVGRQEVFHQIMTVMKVDFEEYFEFDDETI